MALPHYSSLAVIAGVHPTDAETEDEKWAVGEFDENFNCNTCALDGIALPGTYAKGHGVGYNITI